MKSINTDIAVIGGGASGLIAAICAAQKNKFSKIIILEKEPRVGKKILVTGNGRCNLLNTNINTDAYNYSAKKFLAPIFKKYSPNTILSFFSSLGLIMKAEPDGKVYPFCGQASSVLDLLRLELERLGILELCDFKIKNIKKDNEKFQIISDETKIIAKKVIIASGGKAFVSGATHSDIFSNIKQLGHTLTPCYPSLVPIKTNSGFEKSLKGIRSPCSVKFLADNKIIRTELGEVQFTETGLSGICIFQISRLINEFLTFKTINGVKYKRIKIVIDLLPIMSIEDLVDTIYKKIKVMPNLSSEDLFTGIINKRLGNCILKSCGIKSNHELIKNLSDDDVLKIANAVKNLEFNPVGTLPFKNAQVMSGGVSLCEINHETMESLKVKNLYFCGEILDVDGDCGGFNLYWAWLSGLIAGEASVND
ncbi:MAG: 3-dehydro-bile acid delta(4,6)-reductase [Eubacteriales bacterium SKADARSKE-1]|nr:3-dehydro-bile acid delta(4,6)-reductase [Eubacteriales bacterium SKADARSKE-1]